MKKFRLSIALGLLLFAACAAQAQNDVKLAATPKAFQTFYAKFRTAVLKSDRKTIVALTHFPFRYGFDAGDEGTFTKAQFLKRFKDTLGGDTKFFKAKSPKFGSEDGNFYLLDEEYAVSYSFEKKGGAWKFTGYVVLP